MSTEIWAGTVGPAFDLDPEALFKGEIKFTTNLCKYNTVSTVEITGVDVKNGTMTVRGIDGKEAASERSPTKRNRR